MCVYLCVCFQFLDTVTGTYRYYHSPTNRVHLYPPEVTPPATPPATPSKPKPRTGTSEKEEEKAKEREREREREQSKLKRSYSSPDITQDLNAEAARKPTPTVNRETKYARAHTYTCSPRFFLYTSPALYNPPHSVL